MVNKLLDEFPTGWWCEICCGLIVGEFVLVRGWLDLGWEVDNAYTASLSETSIVSFCSCPNFQTFREKLNYSRFR